MIKKIPFVACLFVTFCLGMVYSAWSQDAAWPARWWPAFPQPNKIVRCRAAGVAETLTAQTLAGLVARREQTQNGGELLWLQSCPPPYERWLRGSIGGRDIPQTDPQDVWPLIRQYAEAGLVRGYILYRQDNTDRRVYEGPIEDASANVATALCGPMECVAVEESLEEKAKQIGLPLLLDVRGWTESDTWQRYGEKFSRGLLAVNDPKVPIGRDLAVAADAMVCYGMPGTVYDRLLGEMEPGTPILGWGAGGEGDFVVVSSRQGCLQTATNFTVNLPVLASGATGLDYRPAERKPLEPLPNEAEKNIPAESDRRYVTFILSDGDNVGWTLGNYLDGPGSETYWSDPRRGTIPFGWGMPAADLLQLSPATLDYVLQTATPRDDLVLYALGGYFFLDQFGADRTNGEKFLSSHARRVDAYLRQSGISTAVVLMREADSSAARNAYQTLADAMPSLAGLFVLSYAPYGDAQGKTIWMERNPGPPLPVIQARYEIWADRGMSPSAGTPAQIAERLNKWLEEPIQRPSDRFAWVVIHAWSRFDDAETSQRDSEQPGKGGYQAALWSAERLDPRIQVMPPTRFIEKLIDSRREMR